MFKLFSVVFVILLNSQARCEQKGGDLNVVISDTAIPLMCTVDLKNKGKNGLTGLRGPKGEMGDTGGPGPKGIKGEQGQIGLEGVPGLNGTKGEPGSPGVPGLNGSKGEQGIAGVPGLMGQKGEQGPAGFNGTKGEQGTAGVPGLNGTKGDQGPAGVPGLSIAKGEQGPVGPPGVNGTKGERGLAGVPGNPGICGCLPVPEEESGLAGEDKDWGSMENPTTKMCRYAPESARKEGKKEVYLDFAENSKELLVQCDFDRSNYTCIVFGDTATEIAYNEKKPFWLSEKNEIADKIYDMQSDQFSWLHRYSFAAYTTIRYHCKNSVPYRGSGNADDALMLLTWNGEKIGPEPTASTSITYSVVNDGCSTAAKGEWSYTDIVIKTGYNQRLPIIDFYIQDVGGSDQAIKIEIMELCFG